MRELANHSARSAVSRSVRIQARDTQLKGMAKFAQVGVALICAVACYVLLDWGFMLRSIAILAILVIAGILAQEGFVLLTDARRRMQIAEETAGTASGEGDFYEPIEGMEAEVAAASGEPFDEPVAAGDEPTRRNRPRAVTGRVPGAIGRGIAIANLADAATSDDFASDQLEDEEKRFDV